MIFCRLLIFSQKQFFQNILSGIPSQESNSLDPDQDRQKVGPDLGPTCFQRLSADDKLNKLKHLVSQLDSCIGI